jgi:ammonia channel protein AmtB
MRVLLLSSFLYLVGVVLVLYFKPILMFDEQGKWKEFSFTKDTRHTWFPFWLFCLVWAFVSYFIVSSLITTDTVTTTNTKNIKVGNSIKRENISKPGVYVLDKESVSENGFPKYVYLGPNIPSDIRDE